MDVADFEAAGLYDPHAPNAPDRLALLEYLIDRGASLDDLVEASRGERLTGLAGELQRRGGRRRLTAIEVGAAADVPVDLVESIARAAGLPISDREEPVYREEDIETLRAFRAGWEMFGEEATLRFTRTMGAAVAAIADAAMATFGINVTERFDEAGATELEQARAVSDASALLLDVVPDAIENLFFHHVEAAIRREIAAGGIRPGARVGQLVVGFLDLVAFTPATQRLSSDDLAEAVDRFERDAVAIVGAREGRVVKMIGDEVMFVLPDAAAACDAALALRDAVATSPVLPSVRGGLAVGPLVRGYGDYYGPEVNLAARLVKAADPGILLVTEPVRDLAASASDLRFVARGAQELRGFAEPVPAYALERA